ncbi:immunity 26/phosphotriesterase HocA family protein [Treponema sp. OMZ 788]|uniref:immunity 26/phosphotriesterase HocA family protein n=1 Tax=Treponema sp. OMZ 788 TaxID=2563664 RepID=UPI0020A308B6|nr:immunity 26/phosphotriesterase HocA family protein [Treponema sp. OMZ 788]UTC64120.1 immunity 26/phosphotriesterase HocA family protein [Treponema sp. OMZ 788]
MSKKFILTNEQRKYLGLNPIEAHWEVMDIKGSLYYFDGDTIKKEISASDYEGEAFYYKENELDVETGENRTIVLPKTAKGKPKKLNFTATQSFKGIGVYFSFGSGHVLIGNYTTQKTYYSENLKESKASALNSWIEKWIKETSKEDLTDLENFKNEKRANQKYKEGDIFAFKIGRRQYGFGKILIDIVKLRKNPEFKKNKNYGLNNLMGTALIVKVYHKISTGININLDELEQCPSLPAQPIMDNNIYYGEYKIIGNKKVTYQDLNDAPISTSKSINHQDKDIAYLQYGLIYKEMSLKEYALYKDEEWYHKNYRAESIGFSLNIEKLEECIKAKSNAPLYPATGGGLNNPANKKDKNSIFKAFGMDGDLDYEGNLKLAKEK